MITAFVSYRRKSQFIPFLSEFAYNFLIMHELAVTESILKTALEYATREKATSVTDLYLKIGVL